MIYVYNIQIYHIIQNHKIRLSSRSDHPKMAQSITSSRLNRCHLKSFLHRQSKLYCTFYIVINVSFSAYFLNMLIICAETETGSICMMLHNSRHNCIQISCRTAFTNQHMHPVSCFRHCILIVHTLMICINPSKYIC